MTHLLRWALFGWWFVIAVPTGDSQIVWPPVVRTGAPVGPFTDEVECKRVRASVRRATTDPRAVVNPCFNATPDD